MSNTDYTPEQIEALKRLEIVRRRSDKVITWNEDTVELCIHCKEPHPSFLCWIPKG